MDRKNLIHEEAERIFGQGKNEYSFTETTILLQSQYYNIEDLFAYGANVKGLDIYQKLNYQKRLYLFAILF